MKRKSYILGTAAVVVAIGATAIAAAPTFAHGPGFGQGYGPGYGHQMMGQGYGPGYNHPMMDQGGMGMGPGQAMMGQGNPNCARYNQQTLQKEMTLDDVKSFMQSRLDWRGNDRLKVGKVEATGENTIVAEIVTVDDSLVRRVEFDTKTGAHRPIQ